MAGGHATQSGIEFQGAAAAFIAAHVLAEEVPSAFDLPSDKVPEKLWLEAISPVDDIVVRTKDGGFAFINVKRGVEISADPKSAFGSVIDQFVRQFKLSGAHAGPQEWNRRLDPSKDRLLLFTGGTGSETFVDASVPVLLRIRNAGSFEPTSEIATTEAQRRFVGALLAQINENWKRIVGAPATEREIVELVQLIRISRFDFTGADRSVATIALGQKVIDGVNLSEAAFNSLQAYCLTLASNRATADQASLRATLTKSGLPLKNAPHAAQNIERLKRFTAETLESLHHLSFLDVPTLRGSSEIQILREAADALVTHAPIESFLLLGEPGAGKSGALVSAARTLIERGHPVVVIAVDRHNVSSLDALSRDINISGTLTDILQSWTGQKTGVLFIDALDAARGGMSELAFQDLIRAVLKRVPGWRVIASIRIFDLKFGAVFRDLFVGPPVDSAHRLEEFNRVRHLHVERLTDAELNQIWTVSPLLRDTFEASTPQMRALLRTTFNLFLLANILRFDSGTSLSGMSTQAELLEKYWSYRVLGTDGHGLAREQVLAATIKAMLAKRAMTISGEDFRAFASAHTETLFSENVLAAIRSAGTLFQLVGFSHHVLFDFAVARLHFESGTGPQFVGRLTSSNDLALMLAPGALLALRTLWLSESSRMSFWDVATSLCAVEGVGAFSRMIPARVAAEATGKVEDWNSVYTALRDPEHPHRRQLLSAVAHTLGALAAVETNEHIFSSAAPWCEIVRRLLEVAVRELKSTVKPFIHNATQQSASLSESQRSELNKSSRLILQDTLATTYDPSIASVALPALLRTFSAHPSETSESLSVVLRSEHVAGYGHTDLFWLAHDIQRVFTEGALGKTVAENVYLAAYCTPLPSADEKTNLGNSRILGLHSNRRQDFVGCRFQLVEQFPKFLANAPLEATRSLCAAVDFYAREERHLSDDKETTFKIGNTVARYKPDLSVMWSNYNKSDAVALVEEFRCGLKKLAKENRSDDVRAVVDALAKYNSAAGLWATLLDVTLSSTEQMIAFVEPILLAQPVLEGTDTRKPAGDLIQKLHASGTKHEREKLERAVLATCEKSQAVLFTCFEEANLVTNDAKATHAKLKEAEKLRANVKPYSTSSGWIESDPDHWLKEEGVDLELEPNKAIREQERRLSSAISASKGKEEDLSQLRPIWPDAVSLYSQLKLHPTIPVPLSDRAWETLAQAAELIGLASNSLDDLAGFPDIFEIVLHTLDPDHRPHPVSDAEHEANFARSPSWGGPAPRVTGAQAVMALARAHSPTNPAVLEQIRKLRCDPCPEVRFQIQARINMLFDSNREAMFEVIESSLASENNHGVISGLLGAVWRVLRVRPHWFAEKLIALEDRLGEDAGDKEERVVTQALLQLWLGSDVELARARVFQWIEDPISHEGRAIAIATYLRGAVLLGDSRDSDKRESLVRKRAAIIFYEIANRSAKTASIPDREVATLNDEEKNRVIAAFKILDNLTSQISFGAELGNKAKEREQAY